MIVTKEEFLSLLTHWQTYSTRLALLFAQGTFPDSPFLLGSSVVVIALGTVTLIDQEHGFFAITSPDSGTISVGFDRASFEFGTSAALSRECADLLAQTGPIDQIVTVALSPGIKIFCATFSSVKH